MSRVVLIAIAVVAGVALLVPLLVAMHYFSVHQLLGGLFEDVGDRAGIGPFIPRAIAVLLFVPALLCLRYVFSISKRRRLIGLSVLSGFFAAYYLVLWDVTRAQFFTRDGQSLKCYVVAPGKIVYREGSGFDPVTGRPCRPVTSGMLAKLNLLEARLASGSPMVPISGTNPSFFDLITGEAQVWYVQGSADSISLYDTPGFDPRTGQELIPVTPAIATAWREAETRREQERRAASEQERQRQAKEARRNEEDAAKAAAAEAEGRRKAELAEAQQVRERHLAKLRNMITPSATPSGLVAVAAAFVADEKGRAQDRIAVAELKRQLSGLDPQLHILPEFFRQTFFEEGFFDQVFAGDSKPIVESDMGAHARYAVFGRVGARCQANAMTPGLRTCQVDLNFRVIETNGVMVDSGRIDQLAPGYGDEAALQRGIELLIERSGERLTKAIKRRG